MTAFERYCERKRAQYGDKFVPPTGDAFIDAFNKGVEYRIKVETKWADDYTHTRWGYVGVTSGWQPCFLLMRNVRAYGSSDTLQEGRDRITDAHWLKERRAA